MAVVCIRIRGEAFSRKQNGAQLGWLRWRFSSQFLVPLDLNRTVVDSRWNVRFNTIASTKFDEFLGAGKRKRDYFLGYGR
jgi:hypothetical protein